MTTDTLTGRESKSGHLSRAFASSPNAVSSALTQNQNEFMRFLIRRVGDVSAAEDVFQSFCVRALNGDSTLKDEQKVVPWLYAVLRSVLIDHYRSESARRRYDAEFALQATLGDDEVIDEELMQEACNCFQRLLGCLRPDYAEILRRADLLDESREHIAKTLGLTTGNVRVRLHRARVALRVALVKNCGSCCKNDYSDCSCDNTKRVEH